VNSITTAQIAIGGTPNFNAGACAQLSASAPAPAAGPVAVLNRREWAC
jgi:hypothetical protein